MTATTRRSSWARTKACAAEALTSPFGSVPTALMRQGNFSEITTPIRNPFTGQPFPGNIIPQSQLSPVALRAAASTTRRRTGTGTAQQPAGARRQHATTSTSCSAAVDQNLGNKVRLYVRYNWHDSFNSNDRRDSGDRRSPSRASTRTRCSPTRTRCEPNLLNDFRIGYHRIDFDTLNHFSVNGDRGAGTDLGIPGFDGDVRYNNPGIPSINISNFSGLGAGGTNWYQFDTTFQMSNVLAYNRGSHNVRAGFDLRRLATGRRAANDPRGLFTFTGDIDAATRSPTSCSGCRAP